MEDIPISSITRSCPLHPSTQYIVDDVLEMTYHEEPLIFPRKTSHVIASHDLTPPYPKLVMFIFLKCPLGSPLGVTFRPPPLQPISLDKYILILYNIIPTHLIIVLDTIMMMHILHPNLRLIIFPILYIILSLRAMLFLILCIPLYLMYLISHL